MAVAQDLPSLENRAQYARSENSVVYDINGEKIATLTNNQGRILRLLRSDLAGDEGGRSRDRGSALLRAPRRRFPGHRQGRCPGHHFGVRPSRAPRRSPSSSSRTRSPPRRAGRCFRSCARPRSPTTSSASGQGQDPHRVPERDLLRRGRDWGRGRRPHLLRLQPSRLRHQRRRRHMRLSALSVGGGSARRESSRHRAPTRRATSRRRRRRAATRCCRT